MTESLVGRTVGTYSIEAEIGVSRWGAVYRASQRSMNRTVALKTVSAEMAAVPGRTTHFLEEMQAAAQVSHSHIVTIYEAGCVDGVNFCAMEYINGPALADFLRRDGRVDEQHLLQTIASVAHALEFLWQKKILHQPLEAKNILVDANGTVKLINVLPLDNMPVEAAKDDMLTVGLIIATCANEIGPVTQRVGELVERMVGAPDRKPFNSLHELAQAASDLERDLFPPATLNRPAPAPAKKMSKRGIGIALVVGALTAFGLFWLWQTIHRHAGTDAVPRPADIGTMARVTAGEVGKAAVKDFYLDRYEVTIGDYKQFLDALAAGAKPQEDLFAPSRKNHTPDNWDKVITAIQFQQPLHAGDREYWFTWDSPIIGVDWYDAFAFANWRGKRLPTADEWELAARNTHAPATPTEHTEVYATLEDKSPAGVIGLAGKIGEWTGTAPAHGTAVTCGGPRHRAEISRETRADNIGFRCAADKEVK